MNALSEYDRLRDFVKVNGWKQIDELWLTGTGYVKDTDGEWIKSQASSGDKCTGIAIDTESWEVVRGYVGSNHSHAYMKLIDKILEANPTISIDDAEHRAVKVYIIDVTGSEWHHPLAMIQDWRNLSMKTLQLIETKIIEMNLGLPLTRLFLEKHPELGNMMMSD